MSGWKSSIFLCCCTFIGQLMKAVRFFMEKLDRVVLIMREAITGIRVVKALSKEEYEKERFAAANNDMAASDIRASTIMAIPGPAMQMSLNIGLTAVVVLGAYRVNAGLMLPGVILAFLTYFNMIMMGVMGLNRVFMMLSKASASANRIASVPEAEEGQAVLPAEACPAPAGEGFIRFEHVSFSYGESTAVSHEAFAGGWRYMNESEDFGPDGTLTLEPHPRYALLRQQLGYD